MQVNGGVLESPLDDAGYDKVEGGEEVLQYLIDNDGDDDDSVGGDNEDVNEKTSLLDIKGQVDSFRRQLANFL